MTSVLALLIVLLGFTGQQPPQPVRVVILTDAGEIEADIDVARAPITATNFLKYVDAGLFDGGRFYRTVRPDNQVDKPVKIAVVHANRWWRRQSRGCAVREPSRSISR